RTGHPQILAKNLKILPAKAWPTRLFTNFSLDMASREGTELHQFLPISVAHSSFLWFLDWHFRDPGPSLTSGHIFLCVHRVCGRRTVMNELDPIAKRLEQRRVRRRNLIF